MNQIVLMMLLTRILVCPFVPAETPDEYELHLLNQIELDENVPSFITPLDTDSEQLQYFVSSHGAIIEYSTAENTYSVTQTSKNLDGGYAFNSQTKQLLIRTQDRTEDDIYHGRNAEEHILSAYDLRGTLLWQDTIPSDMSIVPFDNQWVCLSGNKLSVMDSSWKTQQTISLPGSQYILAKADAEKVYTNLYENDSWYTCAFDWNGNLTAQDETLGLYQQTVLSTNGAETVLLAHSGTAPYGTDYGIYVCSEEQIIKKAQSITFPELESGLFYWMTSACQIEDQYYVCASIQDEGGHVNGNVIFTLDHLYQVVDCKSVSLPEDYGVTMLLSEGENIYLFASYQATGFSALQQDEQKPHILVYQLF